MFEFKSAAPLHLVLVALTAFCKLAKYEKKNAQSTSVQGKKTFGFLWKNKIWLKQLVSCFWAKLLHLFRNVGFPVFLSVQNKSKTLKPWSHICFEGSSGGGYRWAENALFRPGPKRGHVWLAALKVLIFSCAPQMHETRSCWPSTTSPTSCPSTMQLPPSWRWGGSYRPSRPLDTPPTAAHL